MIEKRSNACCGRAGRHVSNMPPLYAANRIGPDCVARSIYRQRHHLSCVEHYQNYKDIYVKNPQINVT
jgi:hypothetical protein